MGEAQQLPRVFNSPDNDPEKLQENPKTENNSSFSQVKDYRWWIQMGTYSFLILAGQSIGTLLGRLYFNNGGNSKWMATLVQIIGYPVLFPFLWFTNTKQKPDINPENRFPTNLALVYCILGLFVAGYCMLFSVGMEYLPVTTYTLLGASQLGFNALFSFFLNAQKFTPYIINSIVLLTLSSVLLVFQSDPGDSNRTSKEKYVIGFICTLAASAIYAFQLSATQLAFRKIIKRETLRAVVHLSIYESLVATFVVVIGLFASGEWKMLGREMGQFKTGKASYVMNLFWTAVAWQAFCVGSIGLIFKISSLFSNVISILGLPLGPVLAVLFLHDKLTGLKAISMVLALWGFVSYVYQHYLDDLKMKETMISEQKCKKGGDPCS